MEKAQGGNTVSGFKFQVKKIEIIQATFLLPYALCLMPFFLSALVPLCLSAFFNLYKGNTLSHNTRIIIGGVAGGASAAARARRLSKSTEIIH